MKSIKPKKKIGSRILSWLLVGTFVSILVVGILTYLAYQRATSDLVVERDLQLIFLSAAHLKEEISRYTELLESVARNEEITGGVTLTQQERLLRSSQRLSVFDAGVILMNNFGRVVATVPERKEIHFEDWSDREYFHQPLASSSAYYSNIESLSPDGAEVLVISVPVYGGRGEFIGTLAGMFHLNPTTTSSLYASIVRLRLGQNGQTYILDGSRRMIYNSVTTAPNAAHRTGELNWLEMTGESGALRTRDGEGNDVVVAYARVPGTTWTLVTKDDWRTLTAATSPYANLLLGMLALGMLLPASLVAVILRRRDREVQSFERVQQEFQLTTQIHKMLVPPQPPLMPGWGISVAYQPYELPENDFYDFMFLPDGRLMIALGTLKLSGIPALVTHTSIRAHLRNAAYSGFSPLEALQRTNAVIFPDLKPGETVECLYAILDPVNEQFAFGSAGVRFLANIADLQAPLLEMTSPPLGLTLEAAYVTGVLPIPRESSLLIMSNGLFESRDGRNNLLAHDRLVSLMLRKDNPPQPVADNILYHYRDFVKDTVRQARDVTLVLIEHLPDRQQNLETAGAVVLHSFDEREG